MSDNAFQEAIFKRLDTIQEMGEFSQQEMDLIRSYYRVTHKVLEVDGESYPAWRIQHNNALGPGKGGIRFHQDVSEGEVKSLSLLMSFKNSLAGLPYGGGKGGVKFNPKEKSPEEIEKISRAYARAFSDVIGQDIDIPAPDVYTNGQVMSWILDEYEKVKGHHEPALITGKPIALGGIAIRSDATARGGVIVTEAFLNDMGMAKEGLKVAIQGFGNAGSFYAKMMVEKGHKVVAVSDSSGGVFDENGLPIEEIANDKANKISVQQGAKGQLISNSEILELDVDILVLAALENSITEENAGNVKAKVIVELANGPVSYEGDKILFNKGVHIIPDLLANSGGVTVSYFEWAQNRTGNILDEEYLKEKLVKMMNDAWKRTYSVYKEKDGKIDFRTSAYLLAIRRILEAEKLRGNL